MEELPAGLADPLHLAQPFPFRTLAVIGLLAVLALLWMLWRRLRRRRPPAPAAAVSPPLSPPAAGIGAAITAIRGRFLDADRRRGCHQLSETLRAHLERGGRHRFSTLTAGEIAAAIGDVAVARFFDLLADLQFGRREPSRSDFDGLCDLACDVVVAGGGRRPRGRKGNPP